MDSSFTLSSIRTPMLTISKLSTEYFEIFSFLCYEGTDFDDIFDYQRSAWLVVAVCAC